jgi:lysozyme
VSSRYSERLIDHIKSVETLVSPARHLPADRPGIVTGGYGETSTDLVYVGLHVNEPTADLWLRDRLNRLSRLIDAEVKVPLTRNQFEALLDFVYNVGFGAFLNSTLLVKLNQGDYLGAADEFLRWTYANGKSLPGLMIRRRIEREWFLASDQKEEA